MNYTYIDTKLRICLLFTGFWVGGGGGFVIGCLSSARNTARKQQTCKAFHNMATESHMLP